MSRANRVLCPSCGAAAPDNILQTVYCRPTSTRRGTLIQIQRGTTTEMRHKNRRDFVSVLASSALMITVMVIIWAVTGAGSFWPIWVIFGLGVVLLGSAWRAFRPPNDSGRQVDRD